MSKLFYGALINPQSIHSFQALPRGLIAVNDSGVIEWIEEDVPSELVQDVMAKYGWVNEDVQAVELKEGEFVMPGFVDTHTHAPQFPNIGTGQQYELLDWLENLTFPMEAKFKDVEFARETYGAVVRRVLDCGTTTCCYFGTLHLEASKELANIVHAAGQRAFVGNVNMDRHGSPTYVEDSVDLSVANTRALISHIHSLPPSSSKPSPPLIQPILTPRFAITCTGPLLASLSTLASSDPTLRTQTHICENISEISFTKELFPQCASYTSVYDTYGLLRRNTILAHAVHMTEEELNLVKERGAGISHCPTSNFNLNSGVAKVGVLLDRGIKVGLGTDVSGGFSPSILTAIQHASIASKIIAMQSQSQSQATNPTLNTNAQGFSHRQLSVPALLHLATLGGAQVCDLEKHVGSFEVGKAFDALLVSTRNETGNPNMWGIRAGSTSARAHSESGCNGTVGMNGVNGGDAGGVSKKALLEGDLERFFFCGDDRNVRGVYVHGRLVGGKMFVGPRKA